MKRTELVEDWAVVEQTCDLCGLKVEGDEWGREDGFLVTTRIEYDRTWALWGEIQRETIAADICPECFRGKVVPALEAIGVRFQRIEARS